MKTQEEQKLDRYEPITLKIEVVYTFMPDDSLPEDFDGTREDAVEWFKSDLAENFNLFANPRDIYEHITEEE
jgi:hypothetical protein